MQFIDQKYRVDIFFFNWIIRKDVYREKNNLHGERNKYKNMNYYKYIRFNDSVLLPDDLWSGVYTPGVYIAPVYVSPRHEPSPGN